jgi:hypothetical protein
MPPPLIPLAGGVSIIQSRLRPFREHARKNICRLYGLNVLPSGEQYLFTSNQTSTLWSLQFGNNKTKTRIVSKNDEKNDIVKLAFFMEDCRDVVTAEFVIDLFEGLYQGLHQDDTQEHDISPTSIVNYTVFEQVCKLVGSNFINCRIYSISGSHLNEFENLALSSFISRALKSQQIHVNSPLSKRTYVDGVNLMAVILRLAIQGESKNFDSGGTLISILGLAETIKEVAGKTKVEVSVGTDPEVSYFGDYESFNRIAADLNQNLLNIENQIVNTIKAFD